MQPDTIIIGAGVIGLFTARELALAGQSVTVLERNQAPLEASWAGGGILMPLLPWDAPPGLSQLLDHSQAAYPAICRELAADTDVDPEWTACGALFPGLQLGTRRKTWAETTGKVLLKLNAASVRAYEPGLRAERGALHLPGAAQLRSPRLLKALVADLRHRRVRLLLGEPVYGLRLQSGRVSGVLTARRCLSSKNVVVAAGAWSAKLLPGHPIVPVKGQMLLYRPENALLRHLVLAGTTYLIPRADGRILVGSTTERAGYDRRPTRRARLVLSAAASSLLPALAHAPLERHWTGLRPGSPDHLPFIGAVAGFDNLFVNAGHSTLGLTTAPASGRLLADLLLRRRSSIDATPFLPNRPDRMSVQRRAASAARPDGLNAASK